MRPISTVESVGVERRADRPAPDIRPRPSTASLAAFTVALVVIGAAAAYLFSARQPDVYAAEAEIWVHSPEAQSDASTTLATHRQIAESPLVLESAAKAVGLDAATIADAIRTDVPRGSRILQITVESEDRQVARRIADAVAESYMATIKARAARAYVDTRRDLERQAARASSRLRRIDPDAPEGRALRDELSELRRELTQLQVEAGTQTQLDLIRPAETLAAPVEPKPMQAAAIGAFAALLLGLGASALARQVAGREFSRLGY